jgi:hypothetical protein
MTKEEFQKIIEPLYLLDGKSCQFIKSALEANFDNYIKSKAENLPISDVSRCVGCVGGGRRKLSEPPSELVVVKCNQKHGC